MISSPYFKLGPKQVSELSRGQRQQGEIARGHGWIAIRREDGTIRLEYLTGANPEREETKQIDQDVIDRLIEGDLTIQDIHFDRFTPSREHARDRNEP